MCWLGISHYVHWFFSYFHILVIYGLDCLHLQFNLYKMDTRCAFTLRWAVVKQSITISIILVINTSACLRRQQFCSKTHSISKMSVQLFIYVLCYVIIVINTCTFIIFKGLWSDCFRLLFKPEILVSEESKYFSFYPLWISLLKKIPFGRYFTSYGNYNRLQYHRQSLHEFGLTDF